MTRLDEHLRRELERAGRPADPAGVYEELIRRRERRHIARRLEAGVVTLAVSVGSLVGIWALTRGSGGPIAAPGGEDVIAAVLAGPLPASSGLAIISAQDGSIRTLLAMDRAEAHPVAWSPDGDRLAFWRVAEPSDAEPAGLYTVDLEGGEPSLLFATDLSILDLAWSPDGQRIAFVGVTPIIPGDLTARIVPTLYTVAADGTDLREIQVGRDVHPREVAWSPDGSTLAVTDAGDVLLVDLASGTVTRLPDDGLSSSPAWSPDGREIAFEGGPNAGLQSLFVMNADGTGRRRLTNPDGADGSPTWSPDGRWIAVVRLLPTPTGPSGALGPSGVAGPSGPFGFGATCQVVLVAADGSGERVLLDGPIDGACPSELAWRPAPGASITQAPTGEVPSPTGPPQTSPSPTLDLAAGCDLSALEADHDGDGVPDVAVVATLPRDGGCAKPGKGDTYLGVGLGQTEQDVGAGTFRADLTFGPLDCGAGVGCRAFAAPDLDGDGAAELAVIQDAGASVVILGLYRIERCGPAADCPAPAWLSPIEVAEPGDPVVDLRPGPARIVWGGSVGESFGAYCGPMGGNPPTDEAGVVLWRASADSGGSTATVHEALFRLQGTRLELVSTHDYEVTDAPAGLPPGGGSDLCGAPTSGSSGD